MHYTFCKFQVLSGFNVGVISPLRCDKNLIDHHELKCLTTRQIDSRLPKDIMHNKIIALDVTLKPAIVDLNWISLLPHLGMWGVVE